MRYLVIGFIRFYQLLVSPLLGPRCRFYPSCSDYSLLAFQRFGFFKGAYLTVRRLLKCHPLHPGGFDYVPEQHQTESASTCSDDHLDHTHSYQRLHQHD